MADFNTFWGASNPDDNQDIEHQSGVSRLMNKVLCAICCSPVLLLVAIFLLGWNERRTVCKGKAIVAGKDVVEEVGCSSGVAGDGKLVLFKCDVKQEGLQPFAFSGPLSSSLSNYIGTGLEINPQMLLCVETERSETKKDNVGGGKTTIKTYTYGLQWRNSHVDSSSFQKKNSQNFQQNCGLENPSWPTALPTSTTLYANSAKIGDFTIGKSFVERIALTVPITGSEVAGWNLTGSSYSSNQWVVGDKSMGFVKVSFKGTDWSKPKHTVLGDNEGGTIQAWTAPSSWLCSGFTLSEIRPGVVDKDTLFQAMVDENKAMTWILRLLGFCLAWCAFSLLAGPLEVVADCIPFLGPYLGGAIECIACCVSCLPASACCMLVIGIVWIAMRPLVGGCLFMVFIVIMGGLTAFKCYAKSSKDGSSSGLMGGQVVGQQGQQGSLAPVSEASALAFLRALTDEYVAGQPAKVGEFLNQLSQRDQEALFPFEDMIRSAEDKQKAIGDLGLQWGLNE